MEHNSKSSQASITSVLVPKNEKDGYLLGNEINSHAIANDIIFCDEFNESSVTADLMPKFLFGKKTNTSSSTEENSYSSPFVPGSCESGWSRLDQKPEENVSFTDVFGDKAEQLNQRLSFSSAEIGDEFFHPSDVGKEVLLKDEEDRIKEFTMNEATCSSWSICTRKTMIDTSLVDDNDLPKQRCYTVGEYIRKMSEPLGDMSGEVFYEKVHFGCDASTPMPDGNVYPEFSEIDKFQYKQEKPSYVTLHGGISNLNNHGQNECISPIRTGSMLPMFLYSVKKKEYSFDYKFFIGTKNYENIQRLKEAEEMRKCFNSVEQLNFTLNCSYNSAERTFGIPNQEDTTVLKIDTSGTSIEIAQGENSVTEKWIVQPQELTLDINSKGCRISLMNCSKTDLKFKTKFDSKVTNVCPISGILPAEGEIGLRILVSRYIKKQFKHETEDSIVIACGKKEKAIQVKICKKQKSKEISLKDRSYICF